MKNKEYSYILIVIVFLIILAIINFFVFGFDAINNIILNKEWYHYDYTTGYYDILKIDKDSINYNSSNTKDNYENCYQYSFDKKKDIINLNCGKKIEIKKISNNSINLVIDGYDKVFFKNVDDSLNYEFKNYFGKTIVDYRDEKSQVTEYSKINSDKLLSIIKEDNYSKIIFMGNNCTSVDCVLALDVMEKWIIINSNVYYFDSNEINNDLLSKMEKIKSNLITDINFYNGIYPKVIIAKNGKLIDSYDIKCDGFNCNSLYKK